ncbi:MAG: hypothetical protein L3K08_00190 [Thermoplasmata archaeon]|nr:hypothetical protein [Thermoplasmata archaeon]
MSGAFLVEIRWTAGRKLTLVLTGVILLAGVVATFAGPSGVSVPSVATAYYYSGGAYHLLGYVYDTAGRPMAGIPVVFGSAVPIPPGSTLRTTTDSLGVFEGTFPSPEGNYTYTATATSSSGTSTVSTELTEWPVPAPAGVVSPGYGDIVPVRSGAYAPTGNLLVFFAGPNGTSPTEDHLQYQFVEFDASVQVPGAAADALSSAENYSLGPLTSYGTVASVNLPTPPPGLGPAILVQIVSPNGTVTADAIFPPIDFGPQATLTPATQAAGLVLTELGLVALVLGTLGGLAIYGNDRLSGSLDPYLARRVTAHGFLLSRYLGLLLPLGLGASVGILLTDGVFVARYGSAFPTPLLGVAIAATLGAVAASLAIPFALSHLSRTPVQLLTAALAIVVTFGFLWAPVLAAIGPSVGAGAGTSNAGTFDFDGQMADPGLAPSTLVHPALWGTDLATLVGIVLLTVGWIVVPLGFAYWRAYRGD